MRAERLAWAETPDAAASGKPVETEAAPVRANKVVRKRLIHRSAVRVIARAVDAIAIALVTTGLCIAAGIDVWVTPLAAVLPYALMPVAAVGGVWLAGGYRFRYAGSIPGHLLRVALGGSIVMGLVFLSALGMGSDDINLFAQLCAANALALFALHANYLGVVRTATRKGYLSDNVVIVGATQAAARIVSRNVRERELNILGYFDDRANRANYAAETLMGDTPCLGGIDDLLAWARLPEVDRIVVTVTSTAQQRVRTLIDRMRNLPQEIILVLDLDGFNPEHTSLARVVDAPAAYISGAPRDVYRAFVKRCFDVAVAASAIVVLAAPMALVALLIKLDSKGPVFFRQKRHGFNNEIIRVWKFRTMRPESAEAGRQAEEGQIRQTTANDPRVTRFGRILRLTSIDELPQLLNVLSGEMSIVGPRPHAIGMTAGDIEVHNTVGDYAHRHRMKPGMTGWAQVNGSRGPVHTPEEVRDRVMLDMDYVNRANVWLDAWIVLKTIPSLLGDRQRAR
jgi:polysaccharide biosynthesis protein PslA